MSAERERKLANFFFEPFHNDVRIVHEEIVSIDQSIKRIKIDIGVKSIGSIKPNNTQI